MSSGKQIAKNTMYLYIRMFLVMAVSLYTVRIIIKTLGLVDYGIFSAIGGIVLIMSFLSQTITFAAQRFFSYELGRNDIKRLQEVFSNVLIIYAIAAIVIALVSEIVGVWLLENIMIIPEERMEAAHWVLHFSLLSFIVTIIYTPFNAMIISYENMKVYAYISIIEVFLKLGVVYLLVLANFDKLSFYSFLLFCSSIIIAAFYIFYCYINYKVTHFVFKINRSLFSELASYSSWTMFGTIAGALNNQGSCLLLNTFFGPVANASQSVANQVSHALQLFGANLFAAIRPPMIKQFSQGLYDEVVGLFYQSTKITLFLLLFIMIPLLTEMHFLINMWLGYVGEYMVVFCRLALIYVAVLLLSNPITIIMQAANKVKLYHGIVDSFVLMTLLISYFFLITGADATAVYWTMIVILLIAHFIRLAILSKVINYSWKEYIEKSILPSFKGLVIIIPLILIEVYSIEEGLFRFLATIIMCSFINIALFLSFGFDKKERREIFSIVQNRVNAKCRSFKRFVGR